MESENAVFYKWGGGVGPDFPRIERAYDEFLVTADGQEIIDAAAGAAVVTLGHSLPGVDDVTNRQIDEVSYLSLSHFSHAAPEELAAKLAAMAPAGLSHAFFANSGSEANETAFKLAREYHRRTGNEQKSVVIGRKQSYHGATLGALSATGNAGRRRGFEPLLLDFPHISAAYPYRWSFTGSPEEQAEAAAAELEDEIRRCGPETVAAFIAEPVGGASIPAAAPHPVYYEEVRRICDEYEVLFVADEVMTGFGRTGPAFAMEHYDVSPDLMTIGKGISGGFAPISATLVADHVASAFDDDGFPHGHTFGGNPLSAAVANYVVDQYTPEIFDRGRQRGRQLVEELAPLADHPMVGDFRSMGLMVGLEFVADRETKRPFDPSKGVYEQVYDEALERGVYTYPGSGSVDGVAGDHLMLSPPLTVSEQSVTEIANAVIDSVDAVYERVGAGEVST